LVFYTIYLHRWCMVKYKSKLGVCFLQSVQHYDNIGSWTATSKWSTHVKYFAVCFCTRDLSHFFAISRRWRGFTGYASVTIFCFSCSNAVFRISLLDELSKYSCNLKCRKTQAACLVRDKHWKRVSGLEVCLFLRDCSPAVIVIGEEQRPGCNPRIAHVGYTTEQVVLGHTFLREIPLSPRNYIILPMNQARLSFESIWAGRATGCLYYPYLSWFILNLAAPGKANFSQCTPRRHMGSAGTLPLIPSFWH
jgi:hypothetical protein